MAEVSEKNKMILEIKKFLDKNNLDGYIIPKNDSYFTEYSKINNLYKVTNFKGSAGFALILKKKNYLYVDGRYTLQAKKQSGKKFVICEIPQNFPYNLSEIENKLIGFNPKLFTETTLYKYFKKKTALRPIEFKFENNIKKKTEKFFTLSNKITGENSNSKVNRVISYLKKNKIDYLYVSASENVCWLLNIRGKDLPNSPLANCKLLLTNKKKLFLFADPKKISSLKKQIKKKVSFTDENSIFQVINKFENGNFCIDKNTCSIFDQGLIAGKFKITSKSDPIYNLKSVKNEVEIKNMINAHVLDGVAVTKFLYWFKNNKKKLSEILIEKKLEKFRKKSTAYLYPSFDTIAGSGPNGSIIHYKSNSETNREIKKNDILLLDSGGQYKWGTTDVTRTMCNGRVSKEIKNNFTRVLKGHIAVFNCNINKNYCGHLIDKHARKYLKIVGLNYSHGTGHGVGFFLNVHEGPQGISKNNRVVFKKGMILSNEPGFYLENKYGIRIENLIYVDQLKNNLIFKNLTFAPIDFDMINFKMLTDNEKNYLFQYHLDIYSKVSEFLNKSEKKWLVNLIK